MELINHYQILGLKSGVKYSETQITTAYRKKTLTSHPDKHPNDVNAPSRFQQLQLSYNILKDPHLCQEFDASLVKLKEREKARKDEVTNERIKRKLKEEIAGLKEKFAKTSRDGDRDSGVRVRGDSGVKVDMRKVLKVNWEENVGSDYNSVRLREVFEEFGEVEDVVIRKTKKNPGWSSALVVMVSKEGADRAVRGLIGGFLLAKRVRDDQGLDPGSVGFEAFEKVVFRKLEKVAAAQNLKGEAEVEVEVKVK